MRHASTSAALRCEDQSSALLLGAAGLLDTPEAGGEVHRHVLVALLKAVVLADVVQVVPADDDGALHLHLGDHTWG